MLRNVELLASEVSRLTDAIRELGGRLISIGTQLQDDGEPPTHDFVAELKTVLDKFHELGYGVLAVAISLSIVPPARGSAVAASLT